jgi:hypothetical protein
VVDAALTGEPLLRVDTGGGVRAEAIRDLLVGRHGEVDPRGLWGRDAAITGQLDLDGALLELGTPDPEPVRMNRARSGAQLSYLSVACFSTMGWRSSPAYSWPTPQGRRWPCRTPPLNECAFPSSCCAHRTRAAAAATSPGMMEG